VKPAQVGVGAYQTYVVSVPTEKDIPTVSVRLLVPAGLEHVSPTVKPGWTVKLVHGEPIAAEEPGEEAEAAVTEIIWTGSIPAEFRDEFTFSAKAPTTETNITWKAYQTYRDGSVVNWDLAPGEEEKENADGSESGPASITKIVNDLQPAPQQPQMPSKTKNTDALVVSMVAVVLSVLAIYMARRRTV
jgi:uncharacterized protein YcnI